MCAAPRLVPERGKREELHPVRPRRVLVDTELWYYKAGERALADVGLTVDKDQYLRDMNEGLVREDYESPKPGSSDFSAARHRIDALIELRDIILDMA